MRTFITLLATLLPVISQEAHQKAILKTAERPTVSLIDVATIARIVHCECRGELTDGKIAVIDVCRNYAKRKNLTYQLLIKRKFVCAGEPDSASVALAAQILRREPSHTYTHFFNPSTATDKWFVEYGLAQCGEMRGRHWFFKHRDHVLRGVSQF